MRIYSQRKGSFARSMARAVVKEMPKANELDDKTVKSVLKGIGVIALTFMFLFTVFFIGI